jgi:hypothetical protein
MTLDTKADNKVFRYRSGTPVSTLQLQRIGTTMVSIRRDNPGLRGGLSSRLAILLGAVVGGMFSQMRALRSDDCDEIIVSASSSTPPRACEQPVPAPLNQTAALYLAESAIPHGGLGIFTAVGVPPRHGAECGSMHLCTTPVVRRVPVTNASGTSQHWAIGGRNFEYREGSCHFNKYLPS